MERKRHLVDWMVRGFILFYLFTFLPINLSAQQRFFNLTADEVRIDSVLPVFTCSLPLHDNYADSTYTVDIVYPEFIDMSATDISRCRQLCKQPLTELPKVFSNVVVERKKGALEVIFVPLVVRDGKYQKLVSFMLDVKAASKGQNIKNRRMPTRAGTDATAAERYASHSVLATGRWAKISVPSTGIYQLTDELIRKAGFSDLSKVHVYGYGGQLADDYHALHEIDNYSWFEGGRNLFEDNPINSGSSKEYTLKAPNSGRRKIAVYISAGANSKAQILINGTEVGTLSVSLSSSYEHGGSDSGEYEVEGDQTDDVITVKTIHTDSLNLPAVYDIFGKEFQIA